MKNLNKENILIRLCRGMRRETNQSYAKFFLPIFSGILDFGCGDGKYSFLTIEKRNDIDIIGIDFSRSSIIKAKQRARFLSRNEKLSFIIGDVEKLPFRKDVFDAVLSVNVMHHLPSISQAIQNLGQVVKKGKYLLLTDLLFGNPFILVGRKVWRLIPVYAKDLPEAGPGDEIPTKFTLTASTLRKCLEMANFHFILDERHHHLFVFVLYYVTKVIPFIRFFFSKPVLLSLCKLERFLLNHKPKAFAHVVLLYGTRKL